MSHLQIASKTRKIRRATIVGLLSVGVFLPFATAGSARADDLDPMETDEVKKELTGRDRFDDSMQDELDKRKEKEDKKKDKYDLFDIGSSDVDEDSDGDRQDDKDDDDDDENDDARRSKLEKDWLSDFTDTDFSRHSFRDLGDPRRERDDYLSDDSKRNKDGTDKNRRRMTDDDTTDDDSDADDERKRKEKKDRKKRDERNREEILELTRVDPRWLHDWVPDRVNRLHNGGFTKAADNGFPVPYRLNGHLDIQRKLPWAEDSD